MSDTRPLDPRDTRESVPSYEPDIAPDPLDFPPRRARPYMPPMETNPRAGDPRDRRDTRAPSYDALLDSFQFPQYALAGQSVTSTFGKVYQFDGANWHEGASGTVAPPGGYIFDIGLIEAPPGTVNLEPATPTVIGGITEPAADGMWLRSAAGAVYSWAAAAAGTAYIWGIGLTETIPGTIDLDPATDLIIGGLTEPLPDGLQYARSRSTLGVSTWVPVLSGGAYVGDTAPVAPNPEGQFWFESDTGKLWVRYDNGGAPCWVQVGGP